MRTLGIFTTIWLLLEEACSLIILTDKVRTGLDTSSETDLISAANETFSFEQFKQVINPVALPLISLAKEVSQENHNVFILSARPSEAVNPITEFLRSLNIEVKSVICVGGKPINIAKEKRTVLMSIIENHEVVYFFDDDKTNIQEADKLEGLKAKLS